MTQAKKRYYEDDLTASKDIPDEWAASYKQQLHILFAHWLANNCLFKDFTSAARQAATMIFIQYLTDGRPSFAGEPLPQYEPASLPEYRPVVQDAPAIRFYDETGSINPDADDTQFAAVMAVAFIQWTLNGWHERDFIQVTCDYCSVLAYDYEIACSFGGMGGGKDRKAFLTTPYQA